MIFLTLDFSCGKIEKICEKVREQIFFDQEKVKIVMPMYWSSWHDYLV